MYIPYDKIFETLALILPLKYYTKLKEKGIKLKLHSNLKYISKNQKRVLKKLRKKIQNNEKINVAFYIYDETKWKSQSIYDLMLEDEIFEPYIFVSKNCSPKTNFNYQTKEELYKVYDFFKKRNMRVFYAYDFDSDKFIPFKNLKIKPDIIFYSHPWYIHSSQGPVACSKFALTYYIPYFVATSISPIEYYLRFHQYIGTQYVLNDEIKNYYSINMENKGKNLKAAGHPMLDYFYLNKDKKFDKKDYVIFAPHWSIDKNNDLRWGTFLWSGEFMLKYAKKHPELNWIFKPHPCLKNYLLIKNFANENEVNNYWAQWEKIGKVIESGDYPELFMQSCAMITDCGSFETEYFLTQKPLIHLKNPLATPFNPSVKKIVQTYYEAQSESELEKILDSVIIQKLDYKKEERKNTLKELKLDNRYAAKNIINDIKQTLGANNV